MQSLTSLAATSLLNFWPCEKLLHLPENKRRVLRRYMSVGEQHHVFGHVCSNCFNEDYYCIKCFGGAVHSLTVLAAFVVNENLTPKILQKIPQELHMIFRQCMGVKKQAKFFGDYKEYDSSSGDLTRHAMCSPNGKLSGPAWVFGPKGSVCRTYIHKEGSLVKWDLYDSNQRIIESRWFKNGTESELRKLYYENGQKFSITHWKDLHSHGNYSEYYENGELSLRRHYWNGKRHGLSVMHRRGSYTAGICFYKNDVPIRVWNFWDIFKIYWSMTSCGEQPRETGFL